MDFQTLSQEYIRNKMLPGMYCDAANNDEGQQAACRKCFAAVEGEDEAALEAAIKCSQEFLLPYYEVQGFHVARRRF